MILADISESVERRGEVRVSHDNAVAERPEHESAEHDPDGALPHKTTFYASGGKKAFNIFLFSRP